MKNIETYQKKIGKIMAFSRNGEKKLSKLRLIRRIDKLKKLGNVTEAHRLEERKKLLDK